MKTLEYRFVDKSEWDRGPWDDEPDKVQWHDPATGLACLIRRGPSGALCGYVGIAPHLTPLLPVIEWGYDFRVHGGITYSALCDGDEEHGICHIPEPGEPDPAFWIGFDCGHHRDARPKMLKWERDHGFEDREAVYRDMPYVKREVERLAVQVRDSLTAAGVTPSRPE